MSNLLQFPVPPNIDIDSQLQSVIEAANIITEVKFKVIEGKRSKATAADMWRKGEISRETSAFSFGAGVRVQALSDDNIPYFSRAIYTELATSVMYAAQNLDIAVGWGGVYDLDGSLKDLRKCPGTLEEWHDQYYWYFSDNNTVYSPYYQMFTLLNE